MEQLDLALQYLFTRSRDRERVQKKLSRELNFNITFSRILFVLYAL